MLSFEQFLAVITKAEGKVDKKKIFVPMCVVLYILQYIDAYSRSIFFRPVLPSLRTKR